jgi:phenylacetic acid degradation operon negative regulatory protein
MLAHVPRSLLMTFFGAFLRGLGGWIAVADLVALMGDLGLDEQAVRSAVSRLKRRGVIAADRRDGTAGYRLTETGAAILAAGDARIYGRPAARAAAGSARANGGGDGAWVLVVFTIPETRRALRHRLRARLQFLGLGSVAPGVWIAPAHAEEDVRRAIAELGLTDHVDLFGGRHLAGGAPASWWDLDAIAAEYRAYLAAWEPALGAGPRSRRDAFATHVRHLDAWRRIPFHDPGLPAPALPADWPGNHARAVFRALDRRLGGAARRHVAARARRR